jgi:PAS domain S-box-containing protein
MAEAEKDNNGREGDGAGLGRGAVEGDLLRAKEALEARSKELARMLEEIYQQREWFKVTLSSIGDAVITTDTRGCVTFVNPVAEMMTGWRLEEAREKPLEEVFKIVNEYTLETTPNPITRVLAEGVVVGLANHTALIAKDGTVVSIEDSAAPIRDSQGHVSGAVMVFHDVTERRRREEALQESEARFKATFNQAAMGMAIAGLNARLELVNERFCQMLGYSQEELVAKTVLDLTHADDVIVSRGNIRRLLAGETADYSYEKRFVRKDGSTVWSRTTVTTLKDAEGKPMKFIGVVEDINARKEAERELQRSETRLSLAMEAGQMGAWEWIIGRGQVVWSPTLEAIHGLAPGTFGGRLEDFQRDIHPEDKERVIARVQECLGGGGTYRVEYRIIKPDGKMAWIEARGSLFRDGVGQPERMVGICMDVTARKQIEEARFRLAAVVESSNDAIVSKSLEGIISTWNQGAQRMFGYEAAEIVGKPVAVLIPRERIDEEPAIIEKLKRGEKVENYETVRQCKDGRLVDVSLTVSPIKDGAGRIIGASKILRDITQKKRDQQAREQLLEAERTARAEAERLNVMKDEFLATLSHELRTPLSAILGWSQLLLSGKLGAEGGKQGLETINRNARAQSQLIEDLLDMSRIVLGKVRVEAQRMGLASVVEAAVSAAQPGAQAKGVALVMDLETQKTEVWGDASRLQQVMWNLVSNAVKFTPRGGSIIVSMRRAGGEVEVTVTDTGMGISEAFMPYVFDRFRQGDSSTTRKHGGLGLGLSIVKHLVELHGGRIQARSQGEGKGATFTVMLPALGEEAEGKADGLEDKAAWALARVSLKGLKILVVDDESDARELVRRMLVESKARVFAVGDARQGLEVLERERPDVIVSDVGMPGEDGYQFIAKVRGLKDASLAKVPALALTAFARAEDQARAIEAGYQKHLTKPTRIHELILAVARLAGRVERE